MSNHLYTIAIVCLFAIIGKTDNLKPNRDDKNRLPSEKPVELLKVGDVAPPLKATKWLQGEEVKKFEPGKIYIIEFWASWCGPCIAFMPHTAELQVRYKNQGVICIAYSARDPNNTEDKIAAFIKKRGSKLPLTFAYADDRTTYDAWMTAAGKTGIPCSFVVDRTGRIAYVGNPLYLGTVLPLVVAGNMKAQAVSDKASKIQQEFNFINTTIFRDPKAGLQLLKIFETKYPNLANNPMIIRIKLSFLPKIGEIDEAKKAAEAVMAKAIQQTNSSALLQVAALLRNGPGKESKHLLAVAVKAAEAAVQVTDNQDVQALIDLAETYCTAGDKAKAKPYARKASSLVGDKDAGILLRLAEIYFNIGDKPQAKAYARAAVAAAKSTKLRQYIEQAAQKFDDAIHKDKK